MDFNISISILISSAYFLTLFIFKLLKSPNILANLGQSALSAFGVFILIYSLAIYISISFEKLKRKEANDAIEKIRRLEEEQLARKTAALRNKYSEIDKAIIEKERQKELEDNDDEESQDSTENSVEAAPFNQSNGDNQDIEKLKREAGTQFDSNFTSENIQI